MSMCKDICMSRMSVCAQGCVGKDVYVGACCKDVCMFMQECGYARMCVYGVLYCMCICLCACRRACVCVCMCVEYHVWGRNFEM